MSESSEPVPLPGACASLRAALPEVVDRAAALDRAQIEHLNSCTACSHELLQYRSVLRALHELRTTIVQPAPGLLADILDAVAERGERRAMRSIVSGRRMAYAGGIAMATAAGVTGALLLAGRSRGRGARAA